MKDNINVNVKSLNDNFYIQSFDYSNFRETMDMSLRDVAIDRENAIPVGNDIYNDLQKITDLSDIDSYDPKIRNFLEPSLDIQSLYKQLKGLNKENTHEKLEKIFYSQTKFAKFLNNKFKKKLEREFNKNE
jgi:hypothetical protein